MSENVKTLVFPDGGGGSNEALTAAMLNGGGMNGMWNNPIWAIVFLAALRNGGIFGNGCQGGGGVNGNTDFVASQLGQAVSGNAAAISNLATQLNCTEGQIQGGIQSVLSGICNLSNSMNLSTQSIVNAVNAGNTALANQLCQCCCDMKTLVTEQGYQSQLATLNQTNALQGTIASGNSALSAQIAAQTALLSDKFCELEKREMQNKIDGLREANSSLKGQIDNANQTAQINAYLAGAVAPVNAALAGLQREVDAMKCRLPETVAVPACQGVYLSPCQATLLGINGYGLPYVAQPAATTPTTPTTPTT